MGRMASLVLSILLLMVILFTVFDCISAYEYDAHRIETPSEYEPISSSIVKVYTYIYAPRLFRFFQYSKGSS